MRLFPKKRDYRPRAHCNPFADTNVVIPESPQHITWGDYYALGGAPRFLDIGCGYGKFLISTAKQCADKNICGMEIRGLVAEYVSKRIAVVRENEGECLNACVIHTNAMFFLPNFFEKSSLEKVFVLFPDPQFKKRKRKARIVSHQMSQVYAYLIAAGGRLYVSTDVSELFDSMVECMESNCAFRRLSSDECMLDELYCATYTKTDESQRAAVKTGAAYAAIFEKIR